MTREEKMKCFVRNYKSKNWIPFPLKPISKLPLMSGWLKTTNESKFSGKKLEGNIGVLGGKESGLFFIDVDKDRPAFSILEALIPRLLDLKVPCVRTGSGGYHFYFKFDAKVEHFTNGPADFDGLFFGEFKTTGGYVVAPPSIHPDTKKEYEWMNETIPVAKEIPDWFLNRFTKGKPKKESFYGPDDISEELVEIIENRYPGVFEFRSLKENIYSFKRIKSSRCDIHDKVHDHDAIYCKIDNGNIWLNCCRGKHGERGIKIGRLANEQDVYQGDNPEDSEFASAEEMSSLLKGVSSQKIKSIDEEEIPPIFIGIDNLFSLMFPLKDRDDSEVANFFCKLPESKLLIYSEDQKKAYLGDEKTALWKEVTPLAAQIFITDTLQGWCSETLNSIKEIENSGDEAVMVHKLSRAFGNTSGMNKVAKAVSVRAKNQDLIDSFGKLYNCLPILDKKVYNLDTKETRERTLEDGFTFECNIDFSLITPEMKNEIDDFMMKICCQNTEMLEWLCSAIKSSCYRKCWQRFIIAIGEGSNGKSTIAALMMAMLGPKYATVPKKNIFLQKTFVSEGSGPSPQIVALQFVRLLLMSEFNDKDKIDLDALKKWTAGEGESGRGHHAGEQFVKGEFVLWFLTNSIPKIEWDKALLRRIVCFFFDATFTEDPEKVDPENHIYPMDRTIETRFTKTPYLSAFFAYVIEKANQDFSGKRPEWARNIVDEIKTDDQKLTDWVLNRYVPDMTVDGKNKISLDVLKSVYAKSFNGKPADLNENNFQRKLSILFKKFKCNDKGIKYRFRTEGGKTILESDSENEASEESEDETPVYQGDL